jgi:hypothetical protein
MHQKRFNGFYQFSIKIKDLNINVLLKIEKNILFEEKKNNQKKLLK